MNVQYLSHPTAQMNPLPSVTPIRLYISSQPLCFFHPSSSSSVSCEEMLLKTVSAFPQHYAMQGEALKPFLCAPSVSPSSSLSLAVKPRKRSSGFVISASKELDNVSLAEVVFNPFEELKKDYLAIPVAPQMSMARQNYEDDCETAINEQINVEYNVSYIYHAMFAYFDRDNVALKGLAKFFKESSEEERQHAEKLMEYQNKRGGKVKLYCILMPHSEFDHAEKGDALYAMELALSLEKLTNEKLLKLHSVADRNNDPQLADFIESEFLNEQVEAIKKISEYVAQLRMVGKGHGVWHFDQMLLEGGAV